MNHPDTKIDPAGEHEENLANASPAIDEITSATKRDMLVEQLLAKLPTEESVCDASEIREGRTFSKREILEAIVSFAVDHKLELGKSEIARIITNTQGTVLVLDVKIPNDDGSYQVISFVIKGRHGPNQSRTTNLDRVHFDKDDVPEGGGIVAEYLDGKWIFIA